MKWPLFKSMEKKIAGILDRDYSPGILSLESLLISLSHLYRVGVWLRLAMYRIGVKQQEKLPCRVIAIGNITAGGTGKTPMTLYLAELLIQMGCRPVVVSRGYGGNYRAPAAVVGDGRQVFMDAESAGDEPFMMAARLRFPVVVGRKRYLAGHLAIERFSPDIIIMDDGFQHMALARDLNLVLFDYNRPFGNGRMLPAGRLRETPAMARERLHGVVLTRCPETGADSGDAQHLTGTVFQEVPVFSSRHQPFFSEWYSQTESSNGIRDGEWLKGKTAVLFSGIAHNKAFRKTAGDMGAVVLDHLEFQDHYRYNRADFMGIRDRAETLNADVILTTEKDRTKMDGAFEWNFDVGVIGIRIDLDNKEGFKAFLRSRMNV